ncbi:MAG: hypothetical protein QOJ40_211 [Verrucomicrobiota bacterium]
MDFLKKHYEKILLGVVLFGLAVAVGFLPFKIASEKQKLEDMRNTLIHPKVKPFTNLDLTIYEASLKAMAAPASIDLSSTNRLFNPMPWQQTKDVPPRLIRSDRAGPTAAIVTNIVPLYTRLSFDSVNIGADGSPKYVMGIQKEASPKPAERTKRTTLARVGDKNDTFKLVEAQGPPDNATNLVLQLNDTAETVSVSKAVPFKRADGYMADIKYPLENKNWAARRVGAHLPFNGEDYIIVAITQTEVILSAPNQKKWTIKSNAPPP